MQITDSRPSVDVVAAALAAGIHDAERSIDLSIIRLGALIQQLPEARFDAGLAANIGQRAFEDIGAAAHAAIMLRGQVVRAHQRLSADGTRMGVDVTTLTGGQDKHDGTLTPRRTGVAPVEDFATE